MGHGISEKDSLFVVTGGNTEVSWNGERGLPWHRLGKHPERPPRDINEAMGPDYSGLHWTVEQEPVLRSLNGGPPQVVPGWLLNVRSDTKDVLSVSTPSFKLVQNLEGFQFLADLLGSELAFDTGGSLGGGKDVFIVCRMSEVEHITVGGDQVDRFVSFFNTHVPGKSGQVVDTPVRTVCRNTWDAALGGAVSRWKFRHLGDPTAQLHEARQALNLALDAGKQFKEWGDRLASQQMTERMMRDVVAELWPGEGTDRQEKNAQKRREAVVHLFLEGDTIGNAPGTKWCAANALLEQAEWGAKVRSDEGLFKRHIEDPDGFKRRAVQLVEAA